MTGTLTGLLVVSLEQAVAAPLCTQRLAEAGARVIKIERPEGDFARGYDAVVDGQSAYFVWLNRGKESLVLDIKAPADRALLDRLLARAAIFVQNLAPGAAARAGLESASLRARHPRLITVDISGYGEDGPARDRKAYDLLIQCETGLSAITGSPDEPGRVGVSVADIACGMNAHAAILQALYARQATGTGTGIAVSLFDSIAEWMTVPLLHHDHGGRAPERVGLNHPSIAPYGAYRCGDGRQLVFSIQNDREWRRFCADVLGDAALAQDARFATNSDRCSNRAALDTAIVRALAGLTQAEAFARLDAPDIAYGALNEVADLSVHPQLRRRRAVSPAGVFALPASAMRGAEENEGPLRVPAIGEHSAAIRAEFSE